MPESGAVTGDNFIVAGSWLLLYTLHASVSFCMFRLLHKIQPRKLA